jgi:NAD(P)-dependent dehydrogenase (short-subunit alcohol dehydrogenase family)
VTDIAGRAAVVTGAGSGIGAALAKVLSEKDASVALVDLDGDRAQAVADEVVEAGGKAVAIACDVSERADVKAMKERANAELGPISLVFANAGVTSVDRLTDLSDSDLDWLMTVNMMGPLYTLRAFLPDMIEARDGHVVATASVSGLVPTIIPYQTAYASAKAGVIALMINLGIELAEFGIGSTVVCPSGTFTDIRYSQRYRPERFGGPFEGSETAKTLDLSSVQFAHRPADDLARMILRAVRDNHKMVVSDPTHRARFIEGYSDFVFSAFDDVDEFERLQSEGSTTL